MWLVVSNGWMNPSYSAAAPYHAAFLLGGFLLGRRAGLANAKLLFFSALSVVMCLAAWGLLQEARFPAQRAHALFETPATFAAVINLLLLPSLVVVASGYRRSLFLPVAIFLSAAWVVAESLGGWLALGLAAVVAAVFGHRAGFRLDRRSLGVMAFAMAAGAMLAWLLPILWNAIPINAGGAPAAPALPSIPVHEPAQSSAARLDLYGLALQSVSTSSWLTGYGYLGFYYLMEGARDSIRTYGPGTTYFVHNDYLQVLLELGVPGLLLFVGIVALPPIVAWRSLPLLARPTERLTIVAVVAAASGMSIHAIVDFPFYVPVCIALYGIAIGLVDSSTSGGFAFQRPMQRAGLVALVTIATVLLLKPAAAELAAAHAQRKWLAAQTESAAVWFESARRIEPRDWRYHWYAGQFWYTQARRGGKPQAAMLADEAYAAGYAANPREVRNLLGRILTQRDLRDLLASPVGDVTLQEWMNTAVRLAPLEPALRDLGKVNR